MREGKKKREMKSLKMCVHRVNGKKINTKNYPKIINPNLNGQPELVDSPPALSSYQLLNNLSSKISETIFFQQNLSGTNHASKQQTFWEVGWGV